MQNDDEAQKAIDRRSFLKSAAVGTAAFAAGTSLLSWARPAKAAGSLANVQSDAAKAAKELAGGRVVTLRILEPSGSLGNIKPVADRWTADTGIKVEYIEVPLGEINQKVLLEAVPKAGSFDIALPASFGIPDLAESGILVDLDQLAAKYEPEGYQDSIIYKTANYYKGNCAQQWPFRELRGLRQRRQLRKYWLGRDPKISQWRQIGCQRKADL